jgi:cytochrome oxidase assembly protein ShyY1
MAPTFWQLARKPKWVAGFFAAAAVAVIFAVLMQWQLERTFNVVGIDPVENAAVPLSELTQPGPLAENVYDRSATAKVKLDPVNSFVVQDRLQLVGDEPVRGYWLITNSYVDGASLTLAVGFSEDLAEVQQAQSRLEAKEFEITGYLQPTEAPESKTDGGLLQSLSLAQLINLYSSDEIVSYPVFMILQEGIDVGLETISISIRQQEIQINWLTAFYAVEWAFFIVAAFYIWWRLVRDEQLRIQEAEEASGAA